MKKTKKRYDTPHQVRDKITKYREKHRHFLAVADALEVEADQLIQAGPGFSEDISFKREQAKKLRRSALRIEEKSIPKLMGKLNEIMTELLPGVITDGDKSIPVK